VSCVLHVWGVMWGVTEEVG